MAAIWHAAWHMIKVCALCNEGIAPAPTTAAVLKLHYGLVYTVQALYKICPDISDTGSVWHNALSYS